MPHPAASRLTFGREGIPLNFADGAIPDNLLVDPNCPGYFSQLVP
jgi:hypothetical protein